MIRTPICFGITLIHELVHLLLGETGISGTSLEKEIEKFCDNVASEFLLPTSEFNQFQLSEFSFDSLKGKISNYAFLAKAK